MAEPWVKDIYERDLSVCLINTENVNITAAISTKHSLNTSEELDAIITLELQQSVNIG